MVTNGTVLDDDESPLLLLFAPFWEDPEVLATVGVVQLAKTPASRSGNVYGHDVKSAFSQATSQGLC